MQLFQNVCVRYLSIHFMKPLDLLHLEKKTTGSTGPSYPKAVFVFLPPGSPGGVAPDPAVLGGAAPFGVVLFYCWLCLFIYFFIILVLRRAI